MDKGKAVSNNTAVYLSVARLGLRLVLDCHVRLCCTVVPSDQKRQVSEVSRSDLSRLILFAQDISPPLRLLSASPLLRGLVVGLVSTWPLLPFSTASNGLEINSP
jgi:hypothetical protein